MLTLCINTATLKSEIALIDFKKSAIVLVEKSWKANFNEVEKLLPEVMNLFKKLNKNSAKKIKLRDVKNIVCVSGPGTFTGLRVGITTANILALMGGAKLYEINTFEYLKFATGQKNIFVFAGKGGVYLNKKLLSLSEAEALIKGKKIKELYGDLSVEQIEFFKALSGAKFVPRKKSFGKTVAENFAEICKKQLNQIRPLYIKKPNITA